MSTFATGVPPAGPKPRGWTRQEFERLAELGVFGPEENLELIEGEVLTKLTQNSPHTMALHLTLDALRAAFPAGYYLRIQSPLALDNRNQPEPDLAVVTGSPRDYRTGHPATAILVVEVSDTTLAFDRSTKAGLYARAGIAEYWILNLSDRRLEVYREPAPLNGQPLGHYSIERKAHTL